MKKKLAIVSFGLITSISYSINPPETYKIRSFYNYGKIDGFVQIPKGGQNGTTSIQRPTFKEIGIKHIGFYELNFKTEWKKLVIYTEIKNKTFKGKGKLKNELITHNKKIPANSYIQTNHSYNSYNLGLGYNIYDNLNLRFTPIIEFSATQFKYKYEATSSNDTKIASTRKFGYGQINIGFNSSYKFTENYSLEFNTKYGIKYKGVKSYLNLELINNYKITENLNFLIGLEYQDYHYRDRQKEKQNFMKHKVSPNYKIGLEFKF